MPDDLEAMRGSASGQEMLATGTVIVPITSAARTDTRAADGELSAYVSGANVVLQIYSRSLGAWKAATFS